jgi:glucan biosynthesis protein C
MTCPTCGALNTASLQFCRACGASLSSPPSTQRAASVVYPVRYYGLDALRAIAMLLGIVLHAALPYIGADDIWPSDRNRSHTINTIFQFIHIWRMPLFFILAGFFANLVISNNSWTHWWGNRFLRIGLPLLVFSPLLSLTIPSVFSYGATGTWAFFYSTEGQPYHLWFLWHLLIFAVLTVVARPCYLFGFKVLASLSGIGGGRVLQSAFNSSCRVLFKALFQSRFPLPFIILCFFINRPNGGELIENPAGSGLYFILGYSFFSNRSLISYIKLHWSYYFLLAIALFGFYMTAYIPVLRDGIRELFPELLTLGEGKDYSHFDTLRYLSQISASVLFSYAFLGLAEAKFGSYSARWKFISDGSYWTYIVHLPVVTSLTFFMFKMDVLIEIKFLAAIIATFIICLVTYKYFVRSTFIGLILNGKRQPFGLR